MLLPLHFALKKFEVIVGIPDSFKLIVADRLAPQCLAYASINRILCKRN